MKVSLIATVLNAADHAPTFLASIRAQSRVPDEVIVVDGGSTDGTLELLRAAEGITVIEEPGANIARGGTSPSRMLRTRRSPSPTPTASTTPSGSNGCSSRWMPAPTWRWASTNRS